MSKLMSQKEAARFLGVAPRTLREWEEKGLIERERLPGCWYTEKGLSLYERKAKRENLNDDQDKTDAQSDC